MFISFPSNYSKSHTHRWSVPIILVDVHTMGPPYSLESQFPKAMVATSALVRTMAKWSALPSPYPVVALIMATTWPLGRRSKMAATHACVCHQELSVAQTIPAAANIMAELCNLVKRCLKNVTHVLVNKLDRFVSIFLMIAEQQKYNPISSILDRRLFV